MKPADETVVGVVVEVERLAHLLDPARAQHHDLVGQRHRLDLVVGDVDHRRADLVVQPRDLHPHLHAQLRVEVRERLVEQEHVRPAHDGAPDGHALPLPARQRLGLAVEILVELQDPARLGHLGLDLRFGVAGHLQAETHVLGHVICG
jgi:hypothetical protein